MAVLVAQEEQLANVRASMQAQQQAGAWNAYYAQQSVSAVQALAAQPQLAETWRGYYGRLAQDMGSQVPASVQRLVQAWRKYLAQKS